MHTPSVSASGDPAPGGAWASGRGRRASLAAGPPSGVAADHSRVAPDSSSVADCDCRYPARKSSVNQSSGGLKLPRTLDSPPSSGVNVMSTWSPGLTDSEMAPPAPAFISNGSPALTILVALNGAPDPPNSFSLPSTTTLAFLASKVSLPQIVTTSESAEEPSLSV